MVEQFTRTIAKTNQISTDPEYAKYQSTRKFIKEALLGHYWHCWLNRRDLMPSLFEKEGKCNTGIVLRQGISRLKYLALVEEKPKAFSYTEWILLKLNSSLTNNQSISTINL